MQTPDQILDICKNHGLRRTRALVDVVNVLYDSRDPVTLAGLAAHPALKGHYNDATLYRLMVRLEEHGIVQRLGLHSRAAYYVLRAAGQHRDYLICSDCGEIVTLRIECPVQALEKEIAEKTGFIRMHHELEFYGTCPRCVAAQGIDHGSEEKDEQNHCRKCGS